MKTIKQIANQELKLSPNFNSCKFGRSHISDGEFCMYEPYVLNMGPASAWSQNVQQRSSILLQSMLSCQERLRLDQCGLGSLPVRLEQILDNLLRVAYRSPRVWIDKVGYL